MFFFGYYLTLSTRLFVNGLLTVKQSAGGVGWGFLLGYIFKFLSGNLGLRITADLRAFLLSL